VAIPISGGEWKDIYKFSTPKQPKIDFMPGTPLFLSPDEKYIAFIKKSKNLDISIAPTQGGESVQITDHPAQDRFGAYPSWSHDGRWFVFFSDRNGKREPWIIEIGPDGRRQGEPFQIPFMSKAVGPICWTKQGQIGFSSGKLIDNLFVANADGGEEVQLTYNECMEAGPVWSPDNKYIAYISDLGGTIIKKSVWIVPVQGGKPKEISSNLRAFSGMDYIQSIAWHPNGRSVSCVVRYEDERSPWRIGPWMIDIQSGFSKKIPFDYDGSMNEMAWSPDGERLAFDYKGEEGAQNSIRDSDIKYSNIYTMSSEGGEAVRVIQAKEEGLSFSSPHWSPDGQRIACLADGRIWIVRSQGGAPQPITDKEDGVVNWICRWSPDGENIYCSVKEGQKNVFYSVSFKEGEFKKMEMEHLGDFSPDGKKIVYTKHLKTINQYWLLENFLPENKKD
jgi:Tol biopolymer transport system component